MLDAAPAMPYRVLVVTANWVEAMAKQSEDGEVAGRYKTGIEGLDEITYGGLPKGTQNLLLGDGGSGKTLLAFQLLYNNSASGVPCTFVNLDGTINDLVRNVRSAFPQLKDIKSVMDGGLLNVVEKDMDLEFKTYSDMIQFVAQLLKDVKANNSQIIVIDSLSMLRALLDNDRAFTRMINYLTENLRRFNITSIIVHEVTLGHGISSIPGLYEDSMFDGIFRLSASPMGDEQERVCTVVKMRYSKFKSSPRLVSITPKGIVMGPKAQDIKSIK